MVNPEHQPPPGYAPPMYASPPGAPAPPTGALPGYAPPPGSDPGQPWPPGAPGAPYAPGAPHASHVPAASGSQRSPIVRILGVVLAIPALFLLVTEYLLPTVQTVRWSFQSASALPRLADTDVGGRNYEVVVEDGLAGRFGTALLLAVVPLLAVLVVAPLLAWPAHRAGRVGRWVTRAVLALPLAVFAPVAVAASLQLDARKDGIPSLPSVQSVFWLGSFAVTVALAATAFLAVLRRREGERRPWPAAVVVGAIAVAAVLAAAIQAFTLMAGFRLGEDAPLSGAMYEQAFIFFRYGTASVYGTLMLAVLAVLGTGAGLLIVLSGLRMEVDAKADPADRGIGPRPLWMAVSGILLLAVLAVMWFANRGWLSGITDTTPPEAPTGEVLANTWFPPFVSALVGVLVAALAAVGISGLRPLGRHSEWLLMPFAPVLFVGLTPMMVTGFEDLRADDRIDTLLGLIPPVMAPLVLFVLALLLRGQVLSREARQRDGHPRSWAQTLLPVLPMLGIAFLVTWVARAQDVLWPLISTAEMSTGGADVLRSVAIIGGADPPYGLVMPIWLLVPFVLAAIAAQLFYLDRIALRTGRRPPP